MRMISFSMTTPQILARTKDVTRRLGWSSIGAGDPLQAIEKGQGLRKGERVRRLAVLAVVSVRREALREIAADDVRREGFPDMSPADFVAFFCRGHKGCTPDTEITRIEFRYDDRPRAAIEQEARERRRLRAADAKRSRRLAARAEPGWW